MLLYESNWVIFCCALRFTYTEDPNYGLFLQSVNGLAGSFETHTYWELLVKTPKGKIIRPNVGEYVKKLFICLSQYTQHQKLSFLLSLLLNLWIFLFAGIGCYIPSANEQIILKYNKYWRITSHSASVWNQKVSQSVA